VLHGVPLVGEIVDLASLSLTADIGADVQVPFDNTAGEIRFLDATFTPQLTFTGIISLGSDDEYFPASLTLMGRGRDSSTSHSRRSRCRIRPSRSHSR